ncbi:cytochrome d ubiquinol oxidase subunit II, partial [Xanthomonas perforans]
MDFVLLDYTTLRVIWWLLLGVLLSGYAVMGGFDLGVGALLPFVASNDAERRLVINTVGPVWEGNQVWLILGGGAIFAAFPPLYAVSFSGFYLAMFLILFALILRPVGFKFRGKLVSPRWRSTWDWALFVGGFIPALIMGVAVGNVLLGVPFHFDDSMRTFYTGNLLGLLTPFALLAGLLSVAMLLAHGAAMLVLKTDGPVAERAARFGGIAALCALALFAAGGAWVALGLPGYAVTSVLA